MFLLLRKNCTSSFIYYCLTLFQSACISSTNSFPFIWFKNQHLWLWRACSLHGSSEESHSAKPRSQQKQRTMSSLPNKEAESINIHGSAILFLKRQISRTGLISFHPLCIYSGINNIGPPRYKWNIVEGGVNTISTPSTTSEIIIFYVSFSICRHIRTDNIRHIF